MRRHSLAAVIGASGVCFLVAPAPAARSAPFAGIVSPSDGNSSTRIGCFDPLSLRPAFRPVRIFEYHHAWNASPDGRRVALGMSAPGRQGRIGVRIVNLARGTIDVDVETGVAAEAIAWLTDRRLVAGLQRGGIVLIDPVSGAIVTRWAGWSALDAPSTRTRRRFVMLEPGPRVSRLVTVDRAGSLRSVSLRLPRRRRRGNRDRPALVADPANERAYVLTGGRTALAIDLRTMRVRRRRLGGARPADLRHRNAIWLGGGRLAFSGEDFRGRRLTTTPVGAFIVDTRTWKVRRVDARASGVAVARGRLFAYGADGLRAYTRGGRRMYAVLRNRLVWMVGINSGIAYVATDRATHVLDTRSGRVRRRIPRALDVSTIVRRCPAARR